MIHYEEENHIYTLDGIQIPSVTQICQVLSCYIYKDSDPDKKKLTEEAMRKGTAVHDACEQMDKGETIELYTDDEKVPYLTAYSAFLDEHSVEWIDIEKIVYNEEKGYAGRLDRFGIVDGNECFIDIKTTQSISKQVRTLYECQLTMYADAENKLDKDIMILQLKKDGTYKLIKCNTDIDFADKVIDIYKAITPTPRRRKE